ncbi:MAG: TadE/TadG family type IV pilus assembly protein [Acidocella sp.]|nr:TadE/TadG family type IV pilus assembly protein [Acidocella sp.]
MGRNLRRVLRDRTSAAAVEFAVIAPLMLLLLLGTIELTNVVRMQAKLNIMAGQMAEFVAGQPEVVLGSVATLQGQQPPVPLTGSISDMCMGAAMNMIPFNTGNSSLANGNLGPGGLYIAVGSDTVEAVGGSNTHPVTDWTTDTLNCQPVSYPHIGENLFYISNDPNSLYTTDGTPFTDFSGYGGGGTAMLGASGINVEVVYVYRNILPFLLGPSIVFTATAAARPRGNATIRCITYLTAPLGSQCPVNP